MKDTEGTTDLREPMMEKYHDEENQTNEMFETKEREHLKEKRSRSIASICFYALFSLNVVQFVLLFLCAQNKGSTSSGRSTDNRCGSIKDLPFSQDHSTANSNPNEMLSGWAPYTPNTCLPMRQNPRSLGRTSRPATA